MPEVADLTVRFRSTGMDAVVRDTERGERAISTFSQSASRAGGAMTLGLTLPLIAGGAAAFKWASNLEESTNMVNVIFGESAKGMQAWAETGAEAFGLSTSEALRASGVFGGYFKSAGVAIDELDEKAQGMVQLGGDLASMFNTSVEEANAALVSGLAGETEPLRKYNIFIDDAAMSTMALKMGLSGVTSELTAQEKILVREAIIWEQSTDAQGDYADTAGSAANMTRTFTKQVQNLGAAFGKVLLPIGVKVLGVLSGWLTRLGKISPAMKTAVIVIAAVVAAIGPLLLIFGKLAFALTALQTAFGAGGILAGLGGVLLPIALVAAAVGGLYLAWRTNFLGIQDITDSVVGTIGDFFGRFTALFDLFRDLGEGRIESAFHALGAAIRATFGIDITAFTDKLADWGDRVAVFTDETIGFYELLRDQGLTPVEAGFGAVGNALDRLLGTNVSPFFNDLGAFLTGAWVVSAITAGVIADDLVPALLLFAGISFDALGQVLSALWIVLAVAIPQAVQALALVWALGWGLMKDAVGPTIFVIGVTLASALDAVGVALDLLTAGMLVVGIAWDGAWAGMAAVILTAEMAVYAVGAALTVIWNQLVGFKDGVMAVVQPIVDAFQLIADAINNIPDVPEWMDPGNINWTGGSGDDDGSGALGPEGRLTDIRTNEAAMAMAAPFRLFLAVDLPLVMEGIRLAIDNAWLNIQTDTATLTQQVRDVAQTTFWGMQRDIGGGGGAFGHMDGLRMNVANAWLGIKGDSTTLVFGIRNAVVNQFVAMRTDVAGIMNGFRNVVFGVLFQMQSGEGSVGDRARGIGSAIGGGIYAGLNSWADAIANRAAGIVNTAILAAQFAGQIHSPSRRTLYIGEMLAAGLLIPLRQAERDVHGLLSGSFGGRPSGGAGGSGAGMGGPGGAGTTNIYHNQIRADVPDVYSLDRLMTDVNRSRSLAGARS